MENQKNNLLIALMVIVGIPAFYMIFNSGNPKSLMRFIVKDPSWDLAITVGLCAVIAVLGLILSSERREKVFENMLTTNADYIRQLRKKGKSDEFIAEDFLKTLGSSKGFIHSMAKRKVLRFLAKFE